MGRRSSNWVWREIHPFTSQYWPWPEPTGVAEVRLAGASGMREKSTPMRAEHDITGGMGGRVGRGGGLGRVSADATGLAPTTVVPSERTKPASRAPTGAPRARALGRSSLARRWSRDTTLPPPESRSEVAADGPGPPDGPLAPGCSRHPAGAPATDGRDIAHTAPRACSPAISSSS